jgi:hypothetical protein
LFRLIEAPWCEFLPHEQVISDPQRANQTPKTTQAAYLHQVGKAGYWRKVEEHLQPLSGAN